MTAKKKTQNEIQFDAKSADATLSALLAKKDELRKKSLREVFAPLLPKVKALVEAGVGYDTIAEHLSKDPATRISAGQLKGLVVGQKEKAKPKPPVVSRPSQSALV